MARVHSGEVAHYDFLQFEHLELIRHARALHHPPATLSESARTQLTNVAEQLLTQTNELEWVIADYLRAHAMADIMQTHIDDPAMNNTVEGLGDPVARLSGYKNTVEQMMTAMQSAAITSTAHQMQTIFAAAR